MVGIVTDKTRASKSPRDNWNPRVRSLYWNYKKFKEYWMPDILNCLENWRYYWGMHADLGQGQWAMDAVAKMKQQGRQLTQYNIAKPTIDSIAGTILQMPFDPDFIPLDGEVDSLTVALKKIYYADKEIMNWARTYREIVLHGLIFEGVMKMVVSDQFDPLGNIGFETNLPGSVLFDPNWKTSNRRDCKRCFKDSWLSAKDILKLNPKLAPLLDPMVQMDEIEGDRPGTYSGINPFNTTEDRWGSLYRVIEEYYMDEVTVETEKINHPDGTDEIPDMPDEEKGAYLDAMYPNWSPLDVHIEESKEMRCKLRTAAPSILGDQLIYDGEEIEIQTGSLPFHIWAASRENGQSSGQMDTIKDAQTNLNYIEGLILHKMQHEGGGGSMFYEEGLFASPEEARNFVKHKGRPDKSFKVKAGVLARNQRPAAPVQAPNPPVALYNYLSHLLGEIWPNISKRPPVSMGQSDSRDPSGSLFSQMRFQADNQIYPTIQSLRDFWNDAAESYVLQAGTSYSNEGVTREFIHKGERIVLNERVALPGGQVGIRNDMSKLKKKRYLIVISDRPQSPTDKMANAQSLMQYQQTLPAENYASRALIAFEVGRNFENISPETREKLEKVAGMELEVAMAKLTLEKANAMLQAKQAEAMMVSMEMGPGATTGTPPPGAGAKPPDAALAGGAQNGQGMLPPPSPPPAPEPQMTPSVDTLQNTGVAQ